MFCLQVWWSMYFAMSFHVNCQPYIYDRGINCTWGRGVMKWNNFENYNIYERLILSLTRLWRLYMCQRTGQWCVQLTRVVYSHQAFIWTKSYPLLHCPRKKYQWYLFQNSIYSFIQGYLMTVAAWNVGHDLFWSYCILNKAVSKATSTPLSNGQ